MTAVINGQSDNIAHSMGDKVPVIVTSGNVSADGEYYAFICVVDGTVGITYQGGSTTSFPVVAGFQYTCSQMKNVSATDSAIIHVFGTEDP